MVDSTMPIGGFGVQPAGGPAKGAAAEPAKEKDAGFDQILRESIKKVDRLQHDAEEAIKSAATGDADSVAEVMTAVEKADLAFRMLMQVRNKLVDAYEELLRLRI